MTAPMEVPEAFAPGAVVGPHRIVRLLGVGGMGAVFEAEHEVLAKRVAIKTLRPELAKDPTARLRFQREGRAACRIRHPHVVEVFDVGEHVGTPYLVMEYLDGEDLATRIEREGKLSAERAADVLLPAIAAVATAHEAQIVHRDLKPENIFLTRVRNGGETVKVLDFGISRSTAAGDLRLTGTGSMPGTPLYLSPEQCRGAPADERSDQYALGVVLYECVTGRVPFDVADLYALVVTIAEGRFARPRALEPTVPEALESVIVRAMALDPAQRFESLRAFGRALVPCASPALRAQWRAVFDAAPTPAVAPVAPLSPRSPRGALAESLSGISRCVVRVGLSTAPRRVLTLAGALTLGLVLAAVFTPWRSAPAARPAPAARRPDLAEHAPTPAAQTPPPMAQQTPSIAAPSLAVDAGVARTPQPPRGPVRAVRSAVVRRDAGAPTTVVREPSVVMCGGVPCP